MHAGVHADTGVQDGKIGSFNKRHGKGAGAGAHVDLRNDCGRAT